MRANVFRGTGNFGIEQVALPRAGAGEAIVRMTLTTICGVDLHIVRGEYPVAAGRVIGDGWEAIGGWRLGNSIDGAQAEYRVPFAQANLARIPDGVSDEQVVLLSDIASTGFSGAESGEVTLGDSVVVFAQGPIGLCATIGARLMGASLVIGVDGDERRLAMSKQVGADVVLDYRKTDVAAEVKRLTGGGADVAIEALGTQETFESALRPLRAGGTLSSLGVYSGKLQLPHDAFAAGLFGARQDGVIKVAIRP